MDASTRELIHITKIYTNAYICIYLVKATLYVNQQNNLIKKIENLQP